MNKVKFKEQLVSHFPEAQVQNDGKNIILVFEKGMQQLLKQACSCSYDHEDDALILAKAAKIIRRDILNYPDSFQFTGSFPQKCQEKSVPTNLKYLVSMILNGSSIKDQETTDSQNSLTISQAILYNCKRRSLQSTSMSHHSKKLIPPLPIYIALKIHSLTRSKKLVSELYQLGISISYKRLLELQDQIASNLCQKSNQIGLVCPSQLRHGLFTVGALDNLDHNPSSTTSTESFHGTGISLFQFPTEENAGRTQLTTIDIVTTGYMSQKLPDSYTIVPALAFKKESVEVPQLTTIFENISSKSERLEDAVSIEKEWLDHVLGILPKNVEEHGTPIAWSAYHASCTSAPSHTAAITQLMPLFYEKAASAAMVKHGMTVQQQAIKFLNSDQIPVTVFDEPLFAIAKLVQWKYPTTHGEDKHVVLMGGLHIEMAVWNTIGDYLEGSGWTTALTQADISSSGISDSFLKATHLTKTRYAHQVTAVALAKLQEDAYMSTGESLTKEEWLKNMNEQSPTFQYWDTILRLELLVFVFVRAHREQNFALYLESLKEITPWFFAMDHYNYARWVPVHIHDMENLPSSIHDEFHLHGHWVINKTRNRFSAMPIDQAHEQNNAVVKGSGGAVGLMQSPSALRKWLLVGPEQARMIEELEKQFLNEIGGTYLHHDEGPSTQKSFHSHVLSLIETISGMGNPFLEHSQELIALDTAIIMDESVVETVRTIESLGKEQFKSFYKDVLLDCTTSIHNAIKKNNLSLFKCPKPKSKSKQAKAIENLKNDVSLFSRLYIVAKNRDCDMSSFFKHENQRFPPSISENGILRSTTKSDLMNLLPLDKCEPPEQFDAIAVDGGALVHLLSTANIKTFDHYAESVFIPHLLGYLEKCRRLDLVWDVYTADSIKASTREKRGQGTRRKVIGKNVMPSNWKSFLRNEENKRELFTFLNTKIASADTLGKDVLVTQDENVLTSNSSLEMPPCDHEEADTRLVVHITSALNNGCCSFLIRTVDTDVVVILIGKFFSFKRMDNNVDIWVAFGSGKNYSLWHINNICSNLGEERSLALPFFHSFTGCDTTSAFFRKGKRSAWEAWTSFPEVTETFASLSTSPFINIEEDSHLFQVLQRYVVIMYSKSSNIEFVDEARMEFFCQKNKTMENIPPTADALLQHVKRAIYQASIWLISDTSQQRRPTPESYG